MGPVGGGAGEMAWVNTVQDLEKDWADWTDEKVD